MSYIKDLVSVIVPTYNRADMLPRAIESIQKQTYKNIEIIIIANGCNDNTAEVVNNLKQKYNNIIFLNFKESLGGAEARNKGLNIAKGEFIAFLDDDDEWLENKLEKQLEILKNSDYCIVGCNYFIKYQNNRIRKISLKTEINFSDLLYENEIGSFSFVLTKKIHINNLRITKNLNANQDWDLWLKILLFTQKKAYIYREYLVYYYQHSNKISKNYNNKILADEIVKNNYKKYLNKNQLDFFQMRIDFWNMMNDKTNISYYKKNLFKYLFIILKSPYRFRLSIYYIYLIKVFFNA